MTITKSSWTGQAIYTSYVTGENFIGKEHLVMIQEFDNTGARQPYFKVAYVDDKGNVTAKLAFALIGSAKREPSRGGNPGTERFQMSATWEAPVEPGDNSVGKLDDPYDYPVDGKVEAWTYRPNVLFQTWRYVDFWGKRVPPVFKHVEGINVAVNGEGHATADRLVRTMKHSVKTDAGEELVFLKSSSLQRTDHIEIPSGRFDNFV